MFHTIESDTPFDMVFIYFWEPGNIPDQDIYQKILTCLDCMTGSGIVTDIVLK